MSKPFFRVAFAMLSRYFAAIFYFLELIIFAADILSFAILISRPAPFHAV